jgi:hypothetical protein
MKPQCNSTCQSECGCLCDRTPGAAVPAGYVIDGSNAAEFKVINCRVYNDGKCVTVGEAWSPPHDGRVSQIQCDRGPLDAWHDAQEQEAEDADWREAVNRGIVRAAAVLVLLVTAAVIYSRMA